MIDAASWDELRPLFRSTFRSSLHYSLASLDPDGVPLVTPIGSVLLAEPGHALYFELFAHGLGARLAVDPRVSLLAVDSGTLLWLRTLLWARFPRPPAVRLVGRAASAPRAPTAGEVQRWERRIAPVARLPGSRVLWSELPQVRDLWFDRVDWIRIGRLTPPVRPPGFTPRRGGSPPTPDDPHGTAARPSASTARDRGRP